MTHPHRTKKSDTMKITDQKILILDGAMGTMIQRYSPVSDGNNDMLNITAPDVIARIHREYIDAGADIIETNTFSSNRISQNEYGLGDKAADMAYAGAVAARNVADGYIAAGRKVYVAGSLGPTSKSLSLSPDAGNPAYRPYSFDDIASAYREQAEALVRGGADMLLIETCFDALNVKAALSAITELFPRRDFPVMVSVSVGDKSGRTLTGQTLEAFYTSVRHYPLLSFGLNCSLGAEGLTPLMRDVASFASCATSCYPNAGLPNEMGGYDETPEKMAADMKAMAEEGLLNIAGGCCGTTPDHIRAIAEALKNVSPRIIPAAGQEHRVLKVSGLETVTLDRFTNIGERTNVAGSRKFARLISEKKYEEALGIAAGQIEDGAGIIDISLDDAMLDSKAEMEVFTRHIANDPNVAKAALMIDSSHEETLIAGLKNAQGKSIVNSISLKDGEKEFIRKAKEINALGAAMVVMAFDEEGQATCFRRKTEICARAYRLLTSAGIPPEDIIFDANVLSVATGIEEHSRYAVDFINAVEWIKKNLPGALTSGGISNLSFAFRGNNKVREAMHSVFLYHAVKAGLDMAIVNPSMLEIYDNIDPDLLLKIEDVIFDRRKDATDRLIEKAAEIAAGSQGAGSVEKKAETVGNSSGRTPEERIIQALIKGIPGNLKDDLMAVLPEKGSAVRVIEETLMSGMETVGDYFGKGKMFLPQVVKSARIMKEAVDILQPYLEKDAGNDVTVHSAKPEIVIATVKGDVHDIGKNITAIVLTCNGFHVTDLGVMVEKERILEAAEANRADIIAVSGLITPSLYQMEEICREMSARKMTVPLFIGGATTSALHTAVKLAPLYGYVFYGADASASAVMAKRYMMDREKFIAEEHAAQEKIRSLYSMKKKKSEPAPPPCFPAASYPVPEDLELPDAFSGEAAVRDLMPYFDWKLFFMICRMTDTDSPAAIGLKKEAEEKLAMMEKEEGLKTRYAVEFYNASRSGDTVYMEKDGKRFSIPMLRQEDASVLGDGRKACLSLADFVPEESSGKKSPCGLFAITADTGTSQDLIGQAILDTLAEAASSMLDDMTGNAMRRKDMKIIKPAAGYPSLPDHSVKKDILEHLGKAGNPGITLSETFGMSPDASVCGMIFMHPEAYYLDIRHIGQEQFRRYCTERGMDEDTGRQMLGHLANDLS